MKTACHLGKNGTPEKSPEAEKGKGLADFVQEALRANLERAGGFGHDFLGHETRAFCVANGMELLGERQLGGQRVVVCVFRLLGVQLEIGRAHV